MRKPIFKMSSVSEDKKDEGRYDPDLPKYSKLEEVDWHNEGFLHAGQVKGSMDGLLVYANRIYENHKILSAQNTRQQEEKKQPFRVKIQGAIAENEGKQREIDRIVKERVPKLNQEIAEYKEEISKIRKNPKEHIGGNVSKAGFYIGLFILFFLTIYLFVFYSSASYSAFFKEFTLNSIGVADSIFDPNAIPNALSAGIMELVLILTIPFVFLGLGYLIHKFQENKSVANYIKVLALIIVTFLFDAILAYEITEKIYNIKAENSFDDIEPYSIDLALHSVNFWLIIFAGFIVYIIWGLVFDFTMLGYDKMNSIALHIEPIQEKILKCEEKIDILDKTEHKLRGEIDRNMVDISKWQDILDNHIIYDWQGLSLSMSKFLSGWLGFCQGARLGDEHMRECRLNIEIFVNDRIKPKNQKDEESN